MMAHILGDRPARPGSSLQVDRPARPASRVHPQNCTCRESCRPRLRWRRATLAAAMWLAGVAVGGAILVLADHYSHGLGLGIMIGQPGKSS